MTKINNINILASKFKENLSVIILAGGKGQRLRPLTRKTPKPLIKIGNKALLEHIIRHLFNYNIKNIIIATGYKHKLIKEFVNKKYKNNNLVVYNTGISSDILMRIKKTSIRTKEYILVCYGDTLIDINIDKLIKFYLKNKNKMIMSSYQLNSDFGILAINKNNLITKFEEKPKLNIWFNVGYILFSSNKFEYFNKFKTFKDMLKLSAKKKIMKTFKHYGKHITINTLTELDKAKQLIKKFN
jgi:glucose-1-phosphate cytidylyltransferase